MRIVALFLLTAALCLALSVQVSWQDGSLEVAMQEALAAETETCTGCSDCFKDRWQGAGDQCHGSDDQWECGLIEQQECDPGDCKWIRCFRPCYEGSSCDDE